MGGCCARCCSKLRRRKDLDWSDESALELSNGNPLVDASNPNRMAPTDSNRMGPTASSNGPKAWGANQMPNHWGSRPVSTNSADIVGSFSSCPPVNVSYEPPTKSGGRAESSIDEIMSVTNMCCWVCQLRIDRLTESIIVLPSPDGEEELTIHADCYVCHHDDKPILEYYVIEDGCIWCDVHHVEIFCPSCAGCTKKIGHGFNQVSALDEKWHDTCFVCVKCENPLSGGGGEFEFHSHNGDVYCNKDYEEYCCDKCADCGFAITKRRLSAEGLFWHVECFTCFECGETLYGKAYGKIDGFGDLIFCKTHQIEFSGMSAADLKTVISSKSMCKGGTFSMGGLGDEPPDGDAYGACLSQGIAHALEFQANKIECTPKEQHVRSQSFKDHDQFELKSNEEDDALRFDFDSFAPAVFQDLRKRAFGMSEEDFKRSIALRPLSGGTVGEGKSGSLFFFSWDKRLIVKTVESVEAPFFKKCLSDYHEHLCGEDAPRQSSGTTASLICRFLGFYSIKVAGEKVLRVIVIENVFPANAPMKEMYDLKGVLGSKRFVSDEEIAEKGTKVLKDRNILNRTFTMDGTVSVKMVNMLKRDAKFLHERDRIDYSLLLGIQDMTHVTKLPVKDVSKQWPSPEGGGVKSEDPGEVLFLGIIDILQPYTNKKRMEGVLKRNQHRAKAMKEGLLDLTGSVNRKLRQSEKIQNNRQTTTLDDSFGEPIECDTAHAVSAASPGDYADRFTEFLESLMMGRGGV